MVILRRQFTCVNLLILLIHCIQQKCVSLTRLIMVWNRLQKLSFIRYRNVYSWWFVGTKSDTSLFVRGLHTVLFYVGDVHRIQLHFSSIICYCLAWEVCLKDMRSLKFFLGIQVTTTTQGLYMRKAKYDNDLLHQASLVQQMYIWRQLRVFRYLKGTMD